MMKDIIDRIKAKITGKTAIIGVDTARQPDRTVETTITTKEAAEATEKIEMAFKELGQTAQEAADALQNGFQEIVDAINEKTNDFAAHLMESDKEERERKRAERQNTNNWRKMHHLPMRRKTGGRKKRK